MPILKLLESGKPFNYSHCSFPVILHHSPWIHWENSGLKLYIWGLKTFDQNIYENMFWRSFSPYSGAMISFIFLKACFGDHFLHAQVPWFHLYALHNSQGQSSLGQIGPEYMSTAIWKNTMNFNRTFKDKSLEDNKSPISFTFWEELWDIMSYTI